MEESGGGPGLTFRRKATFHGLQFCTASSLPSDHIGKGSHLHEAWRWRVGRESREARGLRVTWTPSVLPGNPELTGVLAGGLVQVRGHSSGLVTRLP